MEKGCFKWTSLEAEELLNAAEAEIEKTREAGAPLLAEEGLRSDREEIYIL